MEYSIKEQIDFVKDQINVQHRLIKKFQSDKNRSLLHVETLKKFEAHLMFLENFAETCKKGNDSSKSSNNPRNGLLILPEDLENLPDELLQELKLSGGDKTDLSIVGIINELGGTVSLDKLIITYYKKKAEILKRNALIARLSRMIDKGQLFPVPSKKGVYSTREISEEESKSL